MKVLYVICFWLIALLSFVFGLTEGFAFLIWEGVDIINEFLMRILMNLNRKINN